MANQSCVFIESNTTGSGEILLDKALRAGFRVYFLTANPEKYPFLNDYLLQVISLDSRNFSSVERCVAQLSNVRCVMSTSEYFIEISARVAQALGLPGNAPEAIACCRDKWRLAECLQACHVPTADTIRFPAAEQHGTTALWQHIVNHVGAPFVVKPRASSGSIGVRKISDAENLADYLADATNAHTTLMCQRFLDGHEYSVETVSYRAKHTLLGITQKHLGPQPYFVESGHDFPALLDASTRQRIEEVCLAALDAVGFTFGPAHIELRLVDHRPRIIEINPRLAGGMIPQLIANSCDDDPLDLVFDLYCDRAVRWFTPQAASRFAAAKRHASIRFMLAERPGTLLTLQLPANVGESVSMVRPLRGSGDEIRHIGDFSARLAYAIATSPDADIAAVQAQQALDGVTVQFAAPTDEEAADKAQRITQRLENTGRLANALDPQAQALLSDVADTTSDECALLADIDEAHLLTLYRQQLIQPRHALALLREMRRLRNDRFREIAGLPQPRGLYLTWEAWMSETLGAEAAGQLQLGRSRNDLNAAINLLQLRQLTLAVFRQCWQLSATLLDRAESGAYSLPIYSQYQTALPGSFAHYLTAAAQGLTDTLHHLLQRLQDGFRSPLGAGAGGGSTLPLAPEFSASLLGLRHSCANSLLAVSSRDDNLRICSEVQIAMLQLSRIAQDWQFLATQESGVLTFPDRLSGGSSSMPQKKNPWLLEWIKASVDEWLARQQALALALHKTPLSNSYEISSTFARLTPVLLRQASRTLAMMRLLVAGVEVNAKQGEALIVRHFTWATCAAEGLTQHKEDNFRSAHHQVGAAISALLAESPQADDRQRLALMQRLLTQAGQADDMSVRNLIDLHRYGGGAAVDAVQQHIDRLRTTHANLAAEYYQWENHLDAARGERERLIAELERQSPLSSPFPGDAASPTDS